MHQILSLRPYWSEKKNKFEKTDNTHFKNNWRFHSIKDIFDKDSLEQILATIPEAERYNLYFTLAYCTDKKREFQSQEVLCFDLDGIDIDKSDEYIPIVLHNLGLDPEKTAIVNSGNGLHFYILLRTPFVKKEYFDIFREHYAAICQMVNTAIKQAGLYLRPKQGSQPEGGLDASVFEPRRIMRLPETLNRKEGKPEKKCFVIRGALEVQTFDLPTVSGIPVVKQEDAISEKALAKIAPKIDNKAIVEGCAFMKFAINEGDKLNEPQWYAALSIAGRMHDADNLAHAISKQHKDYDAATTDRKLSQALAASGPRTCKSIARMFDGCKTCPHFNTTLVSPITIKSALSIATEHTGFHDMHYDEESGKYKRGKPNYEDLRRFFERDNPYVSHSDLCWVFNGKHYEQKLKKELQNFAQKHFDPVANSNMVKEFTELVLRTNLVRPERWDDSTLRHINFNNGVLDVSTGEFMPHSKEFAFKYVLPYDYDPEARPKIFPKFLDDVTCGDKDLAETLKEFMGYCLSGDDCKGAKALFLEGSGNNGKSTFIKVLKALAGPKNYTTISLRDLGSMERLHALDGSLFNIAEETPDRVADSNAFKNLVDGGEVDVRRLYADNYRIQNRAKLVFTCNDLPETFDTSHGYGRRLLLGSFQATFTKEQEDKDMDLKLMSELPAIFNEVFAAYKRFLANGKRFTESEKSKMELNKYLEDNDPILQWFNERVELTHIDYEVKINLLYESYRDYCEKAGVKNIKAIAWFGRSLAHILPDYKIRYKKATNGRFLKGARLKESAARF